jgi:Tfp pilus assembly protein PilW
VVCAVLGIVLGGVTTVFLSGSRAELGINNRFQAQEAARLALAGVRRDVHNACTASVNAGKTQLTLSIPKTNTATNPATAPIPTQQCGTVNAGNISKVIWCAVQNATITTRYALYRSTTGTCSSASVKVADNLINTLSGFNGFFVPTLTAGGSINFGQFQTVDLDIPVSLQQGTAGRPFRLTERIALRNTVWSTTASTSCSVAAPCTPGPCDYVDVAGAAQPCYPPVLS